MKFVEKKLIHKIDILKSVNNTRNELFHSYPQLYKVEKKWKIYKQSGKLEILLINK
jgi:hypothetical protein